MGVQASKNKPKQAKTSEQLAQVYLLTRPSPALSKAGGGSVVGGRELAALARLGSESSSLQFAMKYRFVNYLLGRVLVCSSSVLTAAARTRRGGS